MTIEKVLREAQRYEVSIRELYAEAARRAGEEAARKFYQVLGADEQSHVDYLAYKLEEWKTKGLISFEGLASALPEAGRVEEAARRAAAGLVDSRKALQDLGGWVEALSRVLKSEEETTAYYRSQVGLLEGDAALMFSRFIEIEEGHTRIVRAEFDLASRTGHWFDFREFDLED